MDRVSVVQNWTSGCSDCVSPLTAVSYFLLVASVCISVCTMCGSLLVICSIVYFKQLHTPSNFIILSLAVADLLIGAVVIPLSTALHVGTSWHHRDSMCFARGVFDILLCASSILNLCFVSVDRYYSVCQPLKYSQKMNSRFTATIIVLIWTTSSLVGVTLIVMNLITSQSRQCIVVLIDGFSFAAALLVFFLPSTAISIVYMMILVVARKHSRSISNKVDQKATITLAVVMGVFFVSWCPLFFSVALSVRSEYRVSEEAMLAFKWLGWSNSMLNPLVYAFFYTWFRTAARMILCREICREDRSYANIF